MKLFKKAAVLGLLFTSLLSFTCSIQPNQNQTHNLDSEIRTIANNNNENLDTNLSDTPIPGWTTPQLNFALIAGAFNALCDSLSPYVFNGANNTSTEDQRYRDALGNLSDVSKADAAKQLSLVMSNILNYLPSLVKSTPTGKTAIDYFSFFSPGKNDPNKIMIDQHFFSALTYYLSSSCNSIWSKMKKDNPLKYQNISGSFTVNDKNDNFEYDKANAFPRVKITGIQLIDTQIILLGLQDYFTNTLPKQINTIKDDFSNFQLKYAIIDISKINGDFFGQLVTASQYKTGEMYPNGNFMDVIQSILDKPVSTTTIVDAKGQVPYYAFDYLTNYVEQFLDQTQIYNVELAGAGQSAKTNADMWYIMERSYLHYYNTDTTTDKQGNTKLAHPYGFMYDFIKIAPDAYLNLIIPNLATYGMKFFPYILDQTPIQLSHGGDFLFKSQEQNSDTTSVNNDVKTMNDEFGPLGTSWQGLNNNVMLMMQVGGAISGTSYTSVFTFITTINTYNDGQIPNGPDSEYNFWQQWYSAFVYIGIPVAVGICLLVFVIYYFRVIPKIANRTKSIKTNIDKTRSTKRENKVDDQDLF
ncbi:MAG: hypothetical protein ACRAS9_01420 [Mycoplasma sp.]